MRLYPFNPHSKSIIDQVGPDGRKAERSCFTEIGVPFVLLVIPVLGGSQIKGNQPSWEFSYLKTNPCRFVVCLLGSL